MLATENATTCLHRLLNFPESIDLKKLIDKAKSLQAIAMEANTSKPFPSFGAAHERSKSMAVRGHSLSFDSSSPTTPMNLVPTSYWEEKWRVLHEEEEVRRGNSQKQVPIRKKGWSEKVRFHLSRTGSDPSHMKVDKGKKDPKSSVRRSLLDDLCRQLGAEEDIREVACNGVLDQKDPLHDVGLIGNTGSEENSSVFSASSSPLTNDQENDSEKSSIVSNSSIDENDDEPHNAEDFRMIVPEDPPLPVSDPPEDVSLEPETSNDSTVKQEAGLKDRKLLSGKLQWLWKFW